MNKLKIKIILYNKIHGNEFFLKKILNTLITINIEHIIFNVKYYFEYLKVKEFKNVYKSMKNKLVLYLLYN